MKIILQFIAGDEVGDEDHVADGGAHAPVQAVPLPDPLPLLSLSLVRGDARGRLWSTRIARWTWGTINFENKPHPVTNLTAKGHSSGGHDNESVSAPRPPGRKGTKV